jgi:hypothetical protein
MLNEEARLTHLTALSTTHCSESLRIFVKKTRQITWIKNREQNSYSGKTMWRLGAEIFHLCRRYGMEQVGTVPQFCSSVVDHQRQPTLHLEPLLLESCCLPILLQLLALLYPPDSLEYIDGLDMSPAHSKIKSR